MDSQLNDSIVYGDTKKYLAIVTCKQSTSLIFFNMTAWNIVFVLSFCYRKLYRKKIETKWFLRLFLNFTKGSTFLKKLRDNVFELSVKIDGQWKRRVLIFYRLWYKLHYFLPDWFFSWNHCRKPNIYKPYFKF